ncbi:hypothetical protein GCM10010461_17410 [Microbacterium aurantiacum]
MSDPHHVDEADYRAVLDLKFRYCRLVDAHDWEGLRALFTVDATFDLPLWDHVMSRDEAMAAYADRMRSVESIHVVSMPLVEVLGEDRVSVEWHMEDRLYLADSTVQGFGRYEDTCVREAGQWKFASLRLVRLRRESTSRTSVESI